MHTDPTDLDAEFEQWLLDAARRDTPPTELTQSAWVRFAKTGGQVAAGVAGGALLSRLHARAASSKWAWLGAGMVAGSALTVAALHPPEIAPREAPDAREQPPVTGVVSNDARREDEAQRGDEARVETPPVAAQAPPARPVASPRPMTREAPRHRRAPAFIQPGARASTLAAEVRALDAVRREIEAGHPERALRAVRAFHDDFPRAQLAADAEGLAIEALLARGDRDRAAERARRFLRDYPSDPHAARFEPIASER